MENRLSKMMKCFYDLCVDCIYHIKANRPQVASNMLGAMAAHIKSELRKAGINIDVESEEDPFTVVGYYEDNSQIFCEHVMATDSNDAIKKLCAKREEKMEDEDAIKYSRNNIVIVEIFRGHLESLNDCSTLSNTIDWPGLRL